MLTSTTNSIEWIEITENLWVITSLSARTRNVIMDTVSDIKDIFWGEMWANGKLMRDAQEKALWDLKEIATEMWADAIIGLRYETIKLDTGIGIYAYWTAVKIKKENWVETTEKIKDISNSGESSSDGDE